jgi:hypothetical protein
LGVGKYLVYRLYKEEGLSLRKKKPQGKRKGGKLRDIASYIHSALLPERSRGFAAAAQFVDLIDFGSGTSLAQRIGPGKLAGVIRMASERMELS